MYEDAAGPPPDEGARQAFTDDALAGLLAWRKTLPGKYLWDETGSTLFDRICESDGYYLARRETALLRAAAGEVASIVGRDACLVEFGSGSSLKTRVVLDALDRPARYVPIDIAAEHLEAAAAAIRRDYPGLDAVVPVHADYTRPITLPPEARDGPAPVLGFFPGSTIGNFAPEAAVAFLERARATLGPSLLLVGVDANPDEAGLTLAYAGDDGLMAALHGNLLTRLARELGAGVEADAFRHEVRVLPDPPRVEAHLVATRPTVLRLGGYAVAFRAGESIHTDTSYKYDPDSFRAIAGRAGWQTARFWPDGHGMLGLHLLRAAG